MTQCSGANFVANIHRLTRALHQLPDLDIIPGALFNCDVFPQRLQMCLYLQPMTRPPVTACVNLRDHVLTDAGRWDQEQGEPVSYCHMNEEDLVEEVVGEALRRAKGP